MCKECGCGHNPNSKYQSFVREHEHSHDDHAHSHPHKGDHEHDPETGEIIEKKQQVKE